MGDPTAVPRRTALARAGALAGAAALAACSTGRGSTAPGGGRPSQPPAGAAGTVASLARIPVGQAVAARDAAGRPIVVAQPRAGTAVAFSAICTHQGCTVAPAGQQLRCPCHGSVFAAATGEVLEGPAPRPLPPVPVHVSGDRVVLGDG